MLWRLVCLGSLLVGCAGAPRSAPVSAPSTAQAPYGFVLNAPTPKIRWEPSGGAVVDNILWVISDKYGWLAGYELPLKADNAPVFFSQHDDGDKRKWEGLAPDGGGGLWLWDIKKRSAFRCRAPKKGCPDLPETIPVAANKTVTEAQRAFDPQPIEYISVEGFAAAGERMWLGLRGYTRSDPLTDVRWPVVATSGGAMTYDGKPWVREGRDYGISALAVSGDTLWMTYSYEASEGDTRDDVASFLARATLDPVTHLPGPPAFCAELQGKAEGIAVWGDDRLIVIFDNDKARKDPADPHKFALAASQDFAAVLDATCPND